jgi:hypothetical protein
MSFSRSDLPNLHDASQFKDDEVEEALRVAGQRIGVERGFDKWKHGEFVAGVRWCGEKYPCDGRVKGNMADML